MCGNDTQINPPNDLMKFTVHDTLVDEEGMVRQTKTTLKHPERMACGANTSLSYTQDNTYDDRHQLATTIRNGVAHIYTYDKSGNMTRDDKTGTTEDVDFVITAATNRLVQRTPSAGTIKRYSYDANGSRSVDCPGVSGCDASNVAYRKYYYDGLGRTVGTDEWAQSAGNPPEYDPLDRLTQATDQSAWLGYDGDNVVRTGYDDSNASWTFIHGPGTDDPLVARYAILSGGQLSSERIAYYGTDGQGRQYVVADTSGADATQSYDVTWGQGGKYGSATVDPDGFDAERSSSVAMKGLSFFRNRFYDSETGRWTQEDPIRGGGRDKSVRL